MFRKIYITSLLVLLLPIIATSFLVEADKNETAMGDDAMEEDTEDGMDKDMDSSSFIVAVSASALVVAIISMINLN
jgi:hypothetical protein